MKKTIVLVVAAMFMALNMNAQDVKKSDNKEKAKTESCAKCAKKEAANEKSCCKAKAEASAEKAATTAQGCCKKAAEGCDKAGGCCKKAAEKATTDAKKSTCCKAAKLTKTKKTK